jgi:hypothetical protein
MPNEKREAPKGDAEAERWVPCACGTTLAVNWTAAVTLYAPWWRAVHHAPAELGGCGAGPVGMA